MEIDYDTAIETLVKHVLTTLKGTFEKYPEYGTRLKSFVFESWHEKIEEEIIQDVTEALENWVSLIILKDVQVTRNDEDVLDISISYFICPTGTRKTLVFRLDMREGLML